MIVHNSCVDVFTIGKKSVGFFWSCKILKLRTKQIRLTLER